MKSNVIFNKDFALKTVYVMKIYKGDVSKAMKQLFEMGFEEGLTMGLNQLEETLGSN